MSHHNKARSFGRKTDQKRALMRGLLKNLIVHERISTTEAKAKELRPMIERLVTRARTDTVANRRLVSSRLGNDDTVVKKLFVTIAPRYKERAGGYTRIIKRPIKATTGRREAYIAFVN
jgi:large subunit ribosomal protein L17